MDPNEALRVIREELRAWNGGAMSTDFDADRLAEHVEALDQWIARDGALPLAWDELGGFNRHIRVSDPIPF
jgi:hypothetical protein